MIQNWEKMKKIFPTNNIVDNILVYASVPIVSKIENSNITVIFSTRNNINNSEVCELVFNIDTLLVQEGPISLKIKPSEVGGFDEDGVMASDLFVINGKKYLTYIGWNRAVSVPFRNAIGIAKYETNTIKKLFNGPILDRSIYDPCFVASNCVIKIKNIYIMYYLSCIKWEKINNKLIHYYNIKIAKSIDGFKWKATGEVAIDFKFENEYAISVPRVLFENNIFKM